MAIFVTADTHFFHANIIEHTHRPFATVEEMNSKIVANWNSVVGPQDTIYHLGDFAYKVASTDYMRHLFDSLNGHKFLIIGNHDANNKVPTCLNWDDVWDVKMVSIGGQKIWLSHYAHRVWPQSVHGSWHLFGHSHGQMEGHGKSMDVGVDTNNFYPYSFDQISERLSKIEFNVDQHPVVESNELWPEGPINVFE
jgi:calcineurin-like phosphoesterase family protein